MEIIIFKMKKYMEHARTEWISCRTVVGEQDFFQGRFFYMTRQRSSIVNCCLSGCTDFYCILVITIFELSKLDSR